MDQPAPAAAAAPNRRTGFYLVLLVLFAASGCAALIYEVVWYQLLQLAIGSTSVSMGILLATYMGGLCIGSLWLPRLNWKQHPLRVYAGLEAGIAVFGLLVLVTLPLLNRVYFAAAGDGFGGMLMRGLLAACCMLPSTILMGASLPAIVRWIEGTPEGVSWWGILYGGNTLGAVAGCLLAGFWLLRLFDMTVATWAAVAVNLVVAVIAWVIAPRIRPEESNPSSTSDPAPGPSQARWLVYLTIGISGATALGAEVVWTRLLGMLLLGTVYVFAIILAVFLAGLAIGSAGGSWLLRRVRPMLALGWCQVLLAVAMLWTSYSITRILPFWSDDVLLTSNAWRMYLLDLQRVLAAVLPGAFFWGASFPLACAALAQRDGNSGRTAGAVYAANTLGGIVGALLVSLSLIPAVGTQHTQQYLLLAAVASGVIALVSAARSTAAKAGVIAAGAAASLCWFGIAATPGDLIAYGRQMGPNKGQSDILYVKEGRNSSVAISRWHNGGATYVNVNGHVEATTEIFDMKLQRMVGHLPGLLHPAARSILGIGFGAGVSAGTFTRYPNIEKIRVCEIEPVIPPASTQYFGEQDYRVLHNPKTRITFDDARHYLMTSNEKFDIIASDPLDVFVKGTAALYSREYFEAVKRHLNPGGYFTLYVPLYETDEITMRSELATFFDAFPYGTVWANNRDGLGYDTVFMGQLGPLRINLEDVERRYAQPDMEPVRQSLRDIGIDSVVDLFATFSGTARDLKVWTDGAPINTDNNLRLSYLAGWGINASMADQLYRKMLVYRKPPTDIFSAPPERMDLLLQAIAQYSGPAGQGSSQVR